MIQQIEINGKDYPFYFSYTCFKKLTRKATNEDPEKTIDQIEFGETAWLLGLNNGAKWENTDAHLKEKDLEALLDSDPSAFKKLQQALEHDMEAFADASDEGKQ